MDVLLLRRSRTDSHIRLPKNQTYNKQLQDCTIMSQSLNLSRPRLGRHTAPIRRLQTSVSPTAKSWAPDMTHIYEDGASTSTSSSAEVDRTTGRNRQRHHITSRELCRILENNGKGNPRGKEEEMSYQYSSFRGRRTEVIRHKGLHRHLVHQSRNECRKAFAKVATFCEHEIARHISSASEQYRSRYRYLQFIDFLEGKESNNDDIAHQWAPAEEPTFNQSLPDELSNRIKSWVLDCHKAAEMNGWEIETERFDFVRHKQEKGLVS